MGTVFAWLMIAILAAVVVSTVLLVAVFLLFGILAPLGGFVGRSWGPHPA